MRTDSSSGKITMLRTRSLFPWLYRRIQHHLPASPRSPTVDFNTRESSVVSPAGCTRPGSRQIGARSLSHAGTDILREFRNAKTASARRGSFTIMQVSHMLHSPYLPMISRPSYSPPILRLQAILLDVMRPELRSLLLLVSNLYVLSKSEAPRIVSFLSA